MFTLILFVTIALVGPTYQAVAPQMGPMGTLDFIKVDACPNTPNKLMHLSFGKDDKNRRIWNAKITLGQDFTDKWTFVCNAHKWTGSEYKKNVFKYSGPICKYATDILPTIRDGLYKKANVPGKCDIKKGNYVSNNIYATEKELKLPSIPYGKFKLEVSGYNEKKEMMGCYILDVESKPK